MKTFDVYNLTELQPANAKGSWLYDGMGNKYLDMYGGHGVISVGHSHPVYINSVTEQLKNIGFYSNSVKNSLQEEAAEKLGMISGYEEYKVFFCSSGTEANENALKLASFTTGRKKIIAFKNSFHGRTSLSLGATDDPSIKAKINEDHDVEFVTLNDREELYSKMNDSVAAVILEGIQGVGGLDYPEKDFLQYLRGVCDQFGILLILDEIQSGCGRTGNYFAHQSAGIKPDLITVAKGIGNGFPVGAVFIHPDIPSRKGMLGSTFGGNHLACAAVISVAEIIIKEKLMWNAEFAGYYIKSKLEYMEGIKKIKGKGLMLGVELFSSAKECRRILLEEFNVLTGYSPASDIIRFIPPLSIEKEETDYFLHAFSSALSQLKSVSDEVFYNR